MEKNNIYCIGVSADKTFSYTVKQLYNNGANIILLDLMELSKFAEIEYYLDDSEVRINLKNNKFVIDGYDNIYCRIIDISSMAPSEKLKKQSKALYYLLNNFLANHEGKIINPPGKDVSNCSKYFHQSRFIEEFKKFDVKVPPSIVTNIPEEMLEFKKKYPELICKGISAQKTIVSSVGSNNTSIEMIRNIPTLFQKKINGPDVRVHQIMEESYSEIILSTDVDYRFAVNKKNNLYQSISVPKYIKQLCININDIIGIPFSGIDFKVCDKTGAWYFLEANSMPAYHGYDIRQNKKISKSIFEYYCLK